MVYSSAPLYLDPHNWHHHQQQLGVVAHGGGGENDNNNPQPHHQQSGSVIHMAPPPPPPPSQAVGGGGSSSSIRPGSMADRARQAKIPQPEPGLKCPRCESTNTKFCYFNNYSLTQPRHFCKMCRRYWTRGGALRNVPVGGGCRRNKRSSKSSTGGGASKSVGGERQPGNINSSTSPISSHSNNTELNNNNNNNSHGNMLDGSLPSQSFVPRLTQFPLMASLQGLNNHSHYGSASSNLGLNFGGTMMSSASQGELGFQIGGNSDQWRSHLFPNFLSGFEPPPHQPSSGLYQFPIDHQSIDHQAVCHPPPSRSSLISSINQQLFRPSMTSNSSSTEQKNNEAAAAVKPEGVANLNLQSKSFLGMSENSQYWVGNSNNNNSTWTTDLSGLNNSSTTSLL